MTRARPTLPQGHGEVLTEPAYDTWVEAALRCAAEARLWAVEVDGEPLARLRANARREAMVAAVGFCERFGIEATLPDEEPDLVIVTGHQPELFHPGVWIKNFLVDRCVSDAAVTGAAPVGINLVVDSDGFDTVALVAPCLGAEVRRCTQYLAVGTTDDCFACAPVPSSSEIDAFCDGGAQMLETLPAPAVRRHFGEFCEALRFAATRAESLGELLAVARRRYEASAGTRYLELPVTLMSSTRSFRRFVDHMARHAEEFATCYNAELGSYREATQTRSSAQPFPDLDREGDMVELPLWALHGSARTTVWARTGSGELFVRDRGADAPVPLDPDAMLAPKALALTMYARLFLADLFVHGVGGGRYDRVTDGVIRRFFGIVAPPFAVASMTVYLPLGGHMVAPEELAEAKARLNRLEHNPDAMLPQVDFDSAEEQERALALVTEKTALVARIREPGEDKKALGARIREVNADLTSMLRPLELELRERLEALEAQAAASEVFTDRSYPFCLWSPAEIQDKVR